MKEVNSTFKDVVYQVVQSIPKGRLMSYGDIAVIAGHPYAARVVGQIAHFGPDNLPWHRVVNRNGDLASGYWGGKEMHQQVLEAEGVIISNYQVTDFKERRWNPHVNNRSS